MRAASRADDEHGQMLTGELQFDLSADDQGLFLAEVDELLQRVEESLVDLERAPDDRALLNEIFRAAHTIKGSSATIGHTRMAALTHAMETRLDDVRKGIAAVTPQLIEALLKAVDVLKLLRDEVETRVAADVDVDAAAAAVERRAGLRRGSADRRRSKRTPSPTEHLPGATHRFTVALEEGPWAAVRALQVLLGLGEHGRVLSSDPPQAEIELEDAKPGSRLIVLVASETPEQVMLDALSGIPEIGSIRVETLNPTITEPTAIPVATPTAQVTPTLPATAPQARASSTTIRIDVARLDALLNLVGELVIDRTRLVQLGNTLVDRFGDHGVLADLQQTAQHIGRITDELQEQVMKSRMLPVETVFSRLPRVVRDVAGKQGKQIDFIVEGKDTELDRSVIEEIGDPLLHLIRNAVDHGIEAPEARLAVGKPAVGHLRLEARHADSFIVISLEDDGNGINVEAVKRKAGEKGVVTAENAERMSDQEAVQLIFSPGLSTAQELSDVSGRGVGLDVVRANVERINGSVEVVTQRGLGTTFIIRLPLTLAIVQALLVRVAGGIYALPIHAVTETLRVEPGQVHRVNQREAIMLRETILPLVALRNVFGADDATEPEVGNTDGSRLVVAVHTTAQNARQVGLIVDVAALIGQAIRDNSTVAAPLPGPVENRRLSNAA